MWFNLFSVAWLSFVSLGLLHVALYKAKLAYGAEDIGAHDMALTVRIGAILALAVGITSWAYMYDSLVVRKDIAMAANPLYLFSRALITLGVLAVWTPCWRLCNKAKHYWPIALSLYSVNATAWVAYSAIYL